MKNNKIYSKPKNGFCGVQNTPSKKDKVKNIFSWLLIGILCLTMCGSLLGTIAFSKDCKTARADTLTYTFNGSNMFFNSCRFSLSSWKVGASREVSTKYTFTREKVLCYYPSYESYLDLSTSPISYTIPARETNPDYFYLPQIYYGSQNTMVAIAMDITRREEGNNVVGFNITNFEMYGNPTGTDDTFFCYVSPETLVGNWKGVNGLMPNSQYPSSGMINNNAVNNGYFFVAPNEYNYYAFYSWNSKNAPLVSDATDSWQQVYLAALMRVYVSSPAFNARIQKIEVGSYLPSIENPLNNEVFYHFVGTDTDGYYMGSVSTPYNYVRYYDEFNSYFEYAIPVVFGSNYSQKNHNSLLYENRTYYINNGSGSSGGGSGSFMDYDSFISYYQSSPSFEIDARRAFENKWLTNYKNSTAFYSDAYNSFYQDFVSVFKSSVEYENILDLEFEDGRIYGLSQSNNFNFTTMLSAAINAPLSAFKDMINFELLGVNLLGLFTGLFTVAFVLFVVRKLT